MSSENIILEETHIEILGTIGIVEIFHEPLRCAYNRITLNIGHKMSP